MTLQVVQDIVIWTMHFLNTLLIVFLQKVLYK